LLDILIPYLSFADLERGLLLISVFVGRIGFFFINLNNWLLLDMFGKYLDEFIFSEKFLKKNFTILSSIEWNVTTAIIPPIGVMLNEFINPLINSLISLFTIILKA